MNNSNILSNVKIVKRHNAGSVLIGILCLFSVLIPALFFLFPVFKISLSGVVNSGTLEYSDGSYSIGIMDIIYTFMGKKGAGIAFIINNGWTSYQIRDNALTYYLTYENIYAIGGWFAISALCALILFIKGLVLLLKGKLNNPHSAVVASGFFMFSNGMILLDSWRLGAYLKNAMNKACELSGTTYESFTNNFFYTLIFACVAGGIFLLVLILYLATLKGKYHMEDLEFVDADVPTPYEKNDGVTQNTLPQGIKEVGGHAFSRNTNLEIATIEDGVSELGIGAFSNCLRLKVVTLPKSVKRIGGNCFFNTPRLKRINYAGSKEEWRYITRGSNWLSKSGTTTVVCSDGAISVNPYK